MGTIGEKESPGSKALPPIVLVLVLGFFKGRRDLLFARTNNLSAHQVSEKVQEFFGEKAEIPLNPLNRARARFPSLFKEPPQASKNENEDDWESS